MNPTARHGAPGALALSVVVPVHNEVESLGELVARVGAVLDALGRRGELILVDDGSSDGTGVVLRRLAAREPRLRIFATRRRRGQTMALKAGLARARGEIVVTLDGDLQNAPEDIPVLLQALDAGADLVTGWRRERHDGWFTRRLPSMAANAWIRRLTGVPIHDHGCALKAYRRWLVDALHLYGDHHRLVTGYAALQGARIAEVPVRHAPRRSGRSKYGLSRLLRVTADALAMHLLLRHRRRPSRWFFRQAAPFFVLAGLTTILAGASADGPESVVVWIGATFILAFAAVSLAAYGLFAELLVRLAPAAPRASKALR